MSLQSYVRPRIVTLKSSTPVLDAARAIEENKIGAVMVHGKGGLVGILTDRDLAIRVLGQGLDPKTTTVGDVMTEGVVALTPADTQASAMHLMHKRNIRRIPLVEDGRLVGIVTLDDLLLDEAAPMDRLAMIVQAQIDEGGPRSSAQSPARRRSTARAESTYGRVVNQVRSETGLDEEGQAETALEIVLESLVRRLQPGGAENLIAQLPSLVQPALYSLPLGPDELITRETIEQELVQSLSLEPSRAAETLDRVGKVIARLVSHGLMEDVRRQLQQPLRDVFS
ncbi:MAG: CBS domain-containing protein [Aquihabitans sp.]